MSSDNNIFPEFKKMLGRQDKERLLKQKGKVFWLTGLSGSGKTSLAINIEKELYKQGYITQIFDGDNIRAGINSDLDFTDGGRKENIRRVAEICRLFLDCGIITISCFISPTIELRTMAKNIIGQKDFIEVFVDVPLEVCEQRDVKGLYKKAREGGVKNFTGIDSGYEKPVNPDIIIDTSKQNKVESAKLLLEQILKHLKD